MKRRRILYLQYTNPAGYPPLEHSSQILAENGWEVLFLGTGALNADNLRFDDRPNIRVLRMRFQSPGIRQKLHYAAFNLWCFSRVLRWRPDCVYCSELLSYPFGLLMSMTGIATVLHEHDIPQLNGPGVLLRFLRWSRAQLALRATFCVVPNAQRGEFLMRSAGVSRTPTVVWNCPRAAEVTPQREQLRDGRVRVLYQGSIAADKLPLAVIEALTQLPSHVTLTVVGYETAGAIGYVEAMKNRAKEIGVSDRLEITGPVPRNELMPICRRHDVGLALMPLESDNPNMSTMAGASNKAFDYLASGLAVLVSSLPDWEEMFVKPGYGLACDPSSANSIAAALSRLAVEPETARAMGERGRQRVLLDWNYDHQFRPVMQGLSASGPAPALNAARSSIQ